MKETTLLDRIAISGTEFPFRPIEEIFEIAEFLNIKNLELWIPHNFKLEELEKVKHDLLKRNLRAICISTWTQLNLPGEIKTRQDLIIKSIKAATALGAPIVNTYFGANENRSPVEAIKSYQTNIEPCLYAAEQENIIITLENEFDRTGIDPTRKAEWVLELVTNINSEYFRLNFDACNFYFAGEEPFPYAFNLLKEYVAYLHMKDGTKYDRKFYDFPGENFLWQDKTGEYICTELGSGAIPWNNFFNRLGKENYEGFITLEPHVPVEKLKSTFEQSLGYLKKYLLPRLILEKENKDESSGFKGT